MLFVISSPLGNLDDFTYRAVKIIPQLDYLLCEDTRKTRQLLDRYLGKNNHIKLLPYHDKNEAQKIDTAVEMLQTGLDIGLISDAGTPTIADPGYKLIRECRKNNIPVIPIPGSCSVISALSVSGMPTDRFTFIGFLPKKPRELIVLLNDLLKLKPITGTVIAFESPKRLAKTLEIIKTALGDVTISIGREMTKMYETYYYGRVSQVEEQIKNQLKGEVTLVLNLNDKR